MALDGAFLYAVQQELQPLIGYRVEKIHQPAKEELILALRSREGSEKLLISASADRARIHKTAVSVENPKAPPMFCMLLRKHLVGARVLSIEQPDLERMVILTLQCTDEFGEISRKQLVLECMGRRSNLVLLDAQGRIVLPQKLRAYAHLEKDVVVIGVSNRAEIWNAEKWAEIEAEELNPENLAAVMEELGF